ncbi:hypothetical protein [Spiroplasma endosymbiont of Polydrusus cervinus]|uniref:hypothetical protein n=1 Tax=Spiroplasma endosymbiont of Polydrusus cervinus TaxID=3066287 RepID=UPI0030D05F75
MSYNPKSLYFENLLYSIENEINNYEDNYILNVDKYKIFEYLLNKYKTEPINLFVDNWYSEKYEEKKIVPIPFNVISNSNTYKYIATMIKIYIPYYGNSNLIKVHLNINVLLNCEYEIKITNNEISFVVELKEDNIGYCNDKINEIKDNFKFYTE